MLLNDKQIIELGKQGYINPFHEKQINKLEDGYKVVSYGTSSFGYDVTLASDFICFEPKSGIFDIHGTSKPKSYSTEVQRYLLAPGEMVLGRTFEWIKIPRNCLVLCIGKSTWARQGLFINVTPIEPSWEGFVTLELSNISNNPIALYAWEGIAQLIFMTSDEPQFSYADKNGKYQNQKIVTEAKL